MWFGRSDISAQDNLGSSERMESGHSQHRGSQAPMLESMELEKFAKPLQSFNFQWFRFNVSAEMTPPDFLDSSDSSSESSSDSSADDEVLEPRPKTSMDLGPSDVDEVLVGRYRSVVHALVRAGTASQTSM